MIKRSMLPVLRLVLGLLAWIAIGLQLTIHIQHGLSVVNFFSYFTNLSNLAAAAVLILGASILFTRREAFEPSDQIRAVSVVNMAVVGIVFTVLLRSADLGSLLPSVNIVLHYVMPCVVVLDWLLQPPRTKLGTSYLLLFQVYPAFYLAYVLIRGSYVGWYPYPFLNPANVGGYGYVAAYAAGIALTFLFVGWAVLSLGNRLHGRVFMALD